MYRESICVFEYTPGSVLLIELLGDTSVCVYREQSKTVAYKNGIARYVLIDCVRIVLNRIITHQSECIPEWNRSMTNASCKSVSSRDGWFLVDDAIMDVSPIPGRRVASQD